jgi:hypothetical protein
MSSGNALSPQDRAWEMAGLARQDGDHAEERRWTEVALGRPLRKRCWSCLGNGRIAYPYQPLEVCSDCKGTGAVDW